MSDATAPAPATILAAEAAHFGRLAADWWDPKGSSAMLHRLNPVRLRFVREAVDRHFGIDPAARRPLAGRRALDVGCGAGLLSEPLARLGAVVTGLDAAPENVAVARAHAEGQALAIDYRCGGIETLQEPGFDLVTSLEVIEHVADPAAFVSGLARALAPGGLLVVSTPNRTELSKLALVTVGEGAGLIPRGTHDWSRFLRPDEFGALIEAAGLRIVDTRGLALSATRGFILSGDMAMNYMIAATHA